MDVDEIAKIIALLENSAVHEFELEREGVSVRIIMSRPCAAEVSNGAAINFGPAMVDAAGSGSAAEASDKKAPDPYEGMVKIESPIVGNYYSRPSPDSDPFVEIGSKVKKGDTLCIVEAMKLMNEIEATVGGTLEKIYLKDGQVVEYGEVLFLIKQD